MQIPKTIQIIQCPKNYDAYDISNLTCSICGQGKLYQEDRLDKTKSACAGWVHPEHGPLSCESYSNLCRKDL